MHSCYSPIILYGFCDVAGNDNGYILSRNYLESNYDLLRMYPMDVIRNHGNDYVVGINAYITENGVLKYHREEAFKQLMEFKKKYEKHHCVGISLRFITVISGDYEESEYMEYELDETDEDDKDDEMIEEPVVRPSTPTNQPTRPASTNAPARPVRCQGCAEDQPNQLAHMGEYGCLHYDADSD